MIDELPTTTRPPHKSMSSWVMPDKGVVKLPEFSHHGLFAHIRSDMIATAGEFIGTVLFLLFALASRQTVGKALALAGETFETTSSSTRLIAYFYISASFGLTLYATATIFYRFTGSIFNPSISFSLYLVGSIKPLRFLMVSTAQMAGGIAANAILAGLTPGKLDVQLDLGEGVNPAQGVFIEMFATSALVLSVLMLGAEKHLLTPHAPLAFAFTLFALTLGTIEYTGTGLNVARAFGTACIMGFPSYHWIYWLGPTLGSILATVFYLFLKSIRYWKINPGQDSTAPLEAPTSGPRQDAPPEEGLVNMAEDIARHEV